MELTSFCLRAGFNGTRTHRKEEFLRSSEKLTKTKILRMKHQRIVPGSYEFIPVRYYSRYYTAWLLKANWLEDTHCTSRDRFHSPAAERTSQYTSLNLIAFVTPGSSNLIVWRLGPISLRSKDTYVPTPFPGCCATHTFVPGS